ncbi:MAG: phytanoyl-CoA dioxygenase family protein [Chloroflexi bacterium]|nr:phytanoyl-CoA dioxygenase family protein [Chloroflexota bacterium]
MTLSDQQLSFFETFGYLVFPGAFAHEAEKITEEFERVWADHGGGHNRQAHDHERRSALVPFIDQSEYLSALLDDPRVDGVVSALLGDDYNYNGSDGNFYVGDTRWHSDGFAGSKYRSIKIAFYLDPVTRDSGCLRVIPGSHHRGDGYAESLQRIMPSSRSATVDEQLGVAGRDMPAVALESQPGDMVLFIHDLKHAAFGGGTRRRMFTINMSQRFRDDDVDELREDIATMVRFWAERAYGDVMIRTAGPRRMRHLEQRLANDGHLPELVRQARQEMSEPSRS